MEVSKDHVITMPDVLKEPTESLGEAIFTGLMTRKDQPAQIDVKTGQRETCGELLTKSVRTALHMSQKNITRQDIVSICSTNHLNSAVPLIASQFLGAVVASIDPSFTDKEMSHLLKTVRPKMIFAIPESVPTLEKVFRDISLNCEIVVFGTSSKHAEFSHFIQPHVDEDKFEPVKIENLKDTALIHFSSGTTGLPKGICLSHYSYMGMMVNSKVADEEDLEFKMSMGKRITFPMTYLSYTTLYWLSGSYAVIGSAIEGHCRLVCSEFDPKEFWNIIPKYKPFIVLITPVQAIDILANKRSDVDVSCILMIFVMGSALPKEYRLKMNETFPGSEIPGDYGQTEVCGGVTIFKSTDKNHRKLMNKPEKIESVGLPMRGMSYKVVDLETNKTLGPNQPGELLVKTKFVMNGYYKVDSSETFDKDGWLKTGDVVYYDEDYCFYVVDRVKEAFKYQGWFIAPVALEDELVKHPAVKLAVVVGIPKDDGHHAMGLVILHDGFQVTEKELEKFVEERVSERQRLRAGVRIIKSVPLTASGKVKRKELKEMVLKGNL